MNCAVPACHLMVVVMVKCLLMGAYENEEIGLCAEHCGKATRYWFGVKK